MKKKVFFRLFTIALLFCDSLFSQRNIDASHYTYLITVNDENDTISGIARIEFVALRAIDTVSFDLVNLNSAGKGMQVKTITEISPDVSTNIKFSHSRDKLKIFIRLEKDDTGKLVINYKGIPIDGLIISKNKYGDKTFFADNWPDRAHHWIPCVDDPADKATVDFAVVAPVKYKVISNGTLFREKINGDNTKSTFWKEPVPLPTKVMVIGIANFAQKTYGDSPADVPVSAWVYAQDSTQGFKNFSSAPSILKFLSDYIGPYPYKKLANVQSKTRFGGMENASAIFYYEESATSDNPIEGLLAHEIAHQWFGDMATEKSFPHVWLSEGFATYLTHIYLESKYGTDSLNSEMKKDREQIVDFAKESVRPVVDSVSTLMKLLNPNSYQKGSWILHMLRRQLGDTVFQKIIRGYYTTYAGKNADTRDFQKICEQESGKDLGWFFDQWLYNPGLPKIELTWKYDVENKSVLITVKQFPKNLFQFPLEIQVRGASGKSQWETLSITKQNQPFSIQLKEKPINIYLDPKTSLLFEGSASMVK